ncbi:MAG: Rab family GTPase [Candidatus Hodarchaeales archaeon]|jgi:small GTP-binding protein
MNVAAKVLLCGDGSVGKTALRERYLGKGFTGQYLTTIGADFAIKEMSLDVEDENYFIKYSIWDLAGQQNFKSVRSLYYTGSHAGILVYDITNRTSFDNIQNWLTEVKNNSRSKQMALILLGNKCDLREELPEGACISPEEGQKLAEALSRINNGQTKVPFLETSAKSGVNVTTIFETIGKTLIDIFKPPK